jgi:hypothetical protein
VKAHGPVCPPFQETTEPDGELTLTLTARPSFNDLYALQPNVGFDPWHWDVRPGIKLAGIFKVTFGTKAGEAIDRMLNDARDKVNADLAARLDFRSNVESAWKQLHNPIPLADDGTSWLRLKPLGLNATPMISDAEFARIYVSLKSQNEAVFGSRPAGYEPVDLTILRHDAVDESFLLSAVGGVEYAALEARARQEWAGKTISMDWGRLKLNDFRVYQSGDRLVIGVSVKAMPHKLPYVEGWLYLVGKPVVKDGRLFFENLDYRANTNNPLVQLAAYLFRDSAKRELERKLSFDLSAPLDQIRNTLNSAKPRPIGDLGEVRLRVDDISVLSPVADAKALRIPVMAKGKLEAVFLPFGSDAGSAP